MADRQVQERNLVNCHRNSQVAGSTTTRFAYDGSNIVADYDGSNVLQHRYVFGAGTDAPIVEYDASGNRTFLSADERGSVVARTNSSGALTAANTYDEYGIPGSANAGLFQYTGQAYIPQIGLYYYKARIYSPTYGRFMQTDPIGYDDGANWYNYVGGDPINLIDPLGLQDVPPAKSGLPIVVTGRRNPCSTWGSCLRSTFDFAESVDTYSIGRFIYGGGGGAPQNSNQAPKHTRSYCLGYAFNRNKLVLGLDAAGVAADIFLGPEEAAIAGLGLGVAHRKLHRPSRCNRRRRCICRQAGRCRRGAV